MEGLRGLAIFLVFVVHFVTLIDPWMVPGSRLHAIAHDLHTIGNTGVDLFFVLSGYLIYGSLISRPQKFLRFMSRRVVRIYPTFAVIFLMYVALSFVFPAQSKIPSAPGAAVSYLAQNFLLLPGLFPIEPMITVAWSLSYEMFFYLAIPLVIVLARLRERTPRFRVAFFLAVAAATVGVCAASGGPVRIVMFVAGVLLHEAVQQRRPSASSPMALLALCLGLLATLLPLQGSGGYALKVLCLFAAFFVVCQTCLMQPSGWLARGFSWTPLRWLGNMSYSYYLIHGLALRACVLLLAVIAPPGDRGVLFVLAVAVPMFATTLLVAAVLFLAVERPFSLTPRPSGVKRTSLQGYAP